MGPHPVADDPTIARAIGGAAQAASGRKRRGRNIRGHKPWRNGARPKRVLRSNDLTCADLRHPAQWRSLWAPLSAGSRRADVHGPPPASPTAGGAEATCAGRLDVRGGPAGNAALGVPGGGRGPRAIEPAGLERRALRPPAVCIAVLPVAAEHFWHRTATRRSWSPCWRRRWPCIDLPATRHGRGNAVPAGPRTRQIRLVHHHARLAVHGGRRRRGARGCPADAAQQRRHPGARRPAGQPDRHDGRERAADPAVPTHQRGRKYNVHLPLFFILLVSNLGGCPTPLGDPPLYMGYLHGVPYTWTLGLWPSGCSSTGWC